MKKTHTVLLRRYSAILTAFMTLFGFATSCNLHKYGAPQKSYIVVCGKVVSEDLKTPLKDIQVVMQDNNSLTDNEGRFKIKGERLCNDSVIHFKDKDGSINGHYEDLDTVFKLGKPVLSKDNNNLYNIDYCHPKVFKKSFFQKRITHIIN